MLVDIYDALAHYRMNKILDALHSYFWWAYMFNDVSDILVRSIMCRKDNPIPKPLEEVKFLDKGNALF